MKVKSELLNKLEAVFEILDQIKTYEETVDNSAFFPSNNTPINENQLGFLQEFSKLLEKITA
ncbi:MAG: hypothetical protein ACTSQH_08155 [Candidatus Hodarchaeales archaeon]